MWNYNNIDELFREASAPTVSQLFDKYVTKEKRFTKDEFGALTYIDPTYAKGDKIGSYFLWLIKMFRTQPERIFEDGSKVTEYLEIYDKIKLKGTTPQEYKRIENFASVPDLYNFIKSFKADTESTENVSSEVMFENDKWVVYAVDNQEDACSLGSNTGWCTAPENSHHYDGYSRMGSLFVFINKFDKNEKYQFHYGSGQLADIDDRNIGMNGFREYLKKGDSNDKDLLNNGLHDIEQQAVDEYQDRYFDEQYNQFDMYFWDQVDYEMKQNIPGFENFNPKIQQYLVEMAREHLTEYGYGDSTDMYGAPEVYVDWDSFFEYIEKDLPEIIEQQQHYINDQTMDEAEQGKLFEYPEEKVAYNYKNIDELIKIAANAPKNIVLQFFRDFINRLVNQVQARDDIETIKTELKSEFTVIFDNYVQHVIDNYNKNINIANEKILLFPIFKKIIDDYRLVDAQSDREYFAMINVLKFVLK